MKTISRRTLLGGLPLAGFAAPPRRAGAASPAPGRLKITKLAYYRSTLRWRDLLFVEVHTDGGIIGLGEVSPPEVGIGIFLNDMKLF